MTTPPPTRPRHDPFEALREPQFALYALCRFMLGAGTMLIQATVAWQVYSITGSKLQLGVIGLVGFVPTLLGLTLLGGAFADGHDRRRTAMAAQAVIAIAAAALMLLTDTGRITMGAIYGGVLAMALATAFEHPARHALLPSVVSPKAFHNAITVGTTAQQLGTVTGPALGGLLIALSGVGTAYLASAVILPCSVVCLWALRPRARDVPARSVSIAAIKEGIRFVAQRQVLLGAMVLDMFAVIFGGAAALLPVFAKDILGVGAWGYGLLLASGDVGALITAVVLVLRPPIQRPGRALLLAVAGFGAATIVFGFSRSYPLSLAAYLLVGGCDQVSFVMRQSTIQLVAPDALRGRVISVNTLFAGASDQLAPVESGFVAAATSATFAVVSGGIACLGVLGLVGAFLPGLRRYRIERHPRPPDLDPLDRPAWAEGG